jgi:hypothetical protein
MKPDLDPLRGLAPALIAATFALMLAPSLDAWAQDAEQEAIPAAAPTPAAEQPQSRRERRRAEQAAAEAEAKAQTAQTQAAAAAPGALAQTVIEADEEEELVCKMYKQTGTKIGKRVCGTQAEWDAWADARAAQAKDVVQEISDRSKFPAAPTVPTALPTP